MKILRPNSRENLNPFRLKRNFNFSSGRRGARCQILRQGARAPGRQAARDRGSVALAGNHLNPEVKFLRGHFLRAD
jgi:hypothetical protein